jgi:SAM-dependent methyltransferase
MELAARVRAVGKYSLTYAQVSGLRAARAATGRSVQSPETAVECGLEGYFHRDGRLHASGWAFHRGRRIVAVGVQDERGRLRVARGYGHPSADIEEKHGPDARNCRFRLSVRCPDPETALSWTLCLFLENGSYVELKDAAVLALNGDAYGRLWNRFLDLLAERGTGDVLELGARARSGFTYRPFVPEGWHYVGLDIVEGPNVDVVGDAHRLSEALEPDSFDAFFTVATFEHLAMPWKVALELNRVLRPGGFGIIVTHQCWPVHEAPWDFWRFTDSAWQCLFNRSTGFEVVEAAMGSPATVTPRIMNAVTADIGAGTAFLGSSVLVRKVCDTALRWDVDVASVVNGSYPG